MLRETRLLIEGAFATLTQPQSLVSGIFVNENRNNVRD
jgi:hypothetical protein